jgi:(2Fe-2S) ferredoxin
MSYYKHHVFFCLNEREDGAACCCDHNAKAVFDATKRKVKNMNLNGKGKVRMNRAGCLDRCSEGPVLVVYPEAVWYTYVDQEDVDEIVESHLKNGKVVERLKI